MTPAHPHPRVDAGSATTEAVIVLPALGLLLALLVMGGRVVLAGHSVEAAAAEAARAASLARTQPQAETDARALAAATLSSEALDCRTTTVEVDTRGFASPPGTPATVAATVTCQVPLADLALPGVPGTRTVTATVTSPLDTYRERT